MFAWNILFDLILISFRAETFLKQTTGDEKAMRESQNLTMFLATHDIITNKLKTSLEEIEGYDELLADIIVLCCNFYEAKMYVAPKEKHLLLKVKVVFVTVSYIRLLSVN